MLSSLKYCKLCSTFDGDTICHLILCTSQVDSLTSKFLKISSQWASSNSVLHRNRLVCVSMLTDKVISMHSSLFFINPSTSFSAQRRTQTQKSCHRPRIYFIPTYACAASSSSSDNPVEEEPLRAKPRRENVDVASAYNIGDTVKESPSLNSTLMNAMRDYFGDDGREVQDYMKRPRNDDGQPMFRVVVIGSGPREVELMKRLKESDVIMGLYYCADAAGVCDLEMSQYGRSSTISGLKSEDVVRFCKWVVADAVFVGPDREGVIERESEGELAAAGITVFQHDVSEQVSNGDMDVFQCLSGLEGEEEGDEKEEALVE